MASVTSQNKPSLRQGQVIAASDETTYTVVSFLGRGGQGEVYRVEGPDGAFALK